MKSVKTALTSTLMIEDEEFDQHLNFKRIFSENGLHLEIKTPYNDYMQIIESKKVDCVMINSELVNNFTFEIIDKIKCNFPWIVVVILLKNPSYEKIFSFVRHGADDFIIKPFTYEDMEKVLTFYYF